MKFGEKLKELRTQNNLTQQELAQKMEISSKTIGRWEKENNIPDEKKLKKLSKILQCTVEDLTGEPVKEKKTKTTKTKTAKVKVIEAEPVKKVKPKKEVQEEKVEVKEEPKEPAILPVTVEPVKEEKIEKTEKTEKPIKEKKFTKVDKGLMHSFSRIINVVSRIAQVVLVIAMCLIGIVMVCLPALFNRIEIHDDMIKFDVGREALVIKEDEDGLTVSYKDEKIFTGKINKEIYDRPVLNIFKTSSKTSIIWHIEALIFIGLLCLIAYYLIFGYLARITKNISKNQVFDLSNVTNLKKMAYMFMALIVVGNVASLIALSFINMHVNITIHFGQIILILCLFLLALVFKYGYQLEKKNHEEL